MRPTLRLALAAITVLIVALIGAAGASRSAAATDTSGLEVRRIQAHFDSVLVELAARPVGQLGGDRLARRATLARELRDYRDRATFPHNYDFPGRAVPYFVDRKTGTLCAVANLLAFTGRRDIVDRVARADNNVWVAQIAGDTAFARWLDANGITLAEAARIQMPYVEAPPTAAQQARNDVFFVVAPLSVGSSVLSSLWNATGNSDGHGRIANTVGLVSSVLTLAVGATTAGKRDVPAFVPATSVTLGTLGLALSTRGIMRHREGVLARKALEQRSTHEVSVAPMVAPSGGAGVSVALRF
jgi:hypothetical protein